MRHTAYPLGSLYLNPAPASPPRRHSASHGPAPNPAGVVYCAACSDHRAPADRRLAQPSTGLCWACTQASRRAGDGNA